MFLRRRAKFLRRYLYVALVGLVSACGHANSTASDILIREGESVAETSHGPERVSTVGLKIVTAQGVYSCSGAIYGERTIVTAAHCFGEGGVKKVYAYFGTDMNDATSPRDFTLVTGIKIHPNYKPIAHSSQIVAHDVALLKLSASIPRGYSPIKVLADDAAFKDQETVRLAGYGITEDGDGGDVLRFVDTTLAQQDAEGRLGINDPDKKGACSGDSGGPLFVQRNGAWFVGGVLSGGPIPCRGVNVYTSLPFHRNFLDQAAASFQ